MKRMWKFSRKHHTEAFLALFLFLAVSGAAQDWNAQFNEAESAFNGRSQSECIPLFRNLIEQIRGAMGTRELSSQEIDTMSRSLDYLGQAYFNLNQQEQVRATLLQLIAIRPDYTINQDLVSSKFIAIYTKMKQENLAGLSITVSPAGAIVKLDGRVMAGPGSMQVVQGDHEIEASKSGFLAQKKSVHINTGETGTVDIALAPDPAIRQAYDAAIQQLGKYDAPAARNAMQAALKTDPNNSLDRGALAEALLIMGFEKDARTEAAQALDHSSALPADDVLLMQGLANETAGDCAHASAAYSKYLSAHTNSVDAAVRLARSQICSGNARDATETARGQRFKGSNDPRLDLLEAEASELLADFQDQQDLAATAVTGALAANAPMLAMRARLVQGRALMQLQNEAQARRIFQEVLNQPEAESDPYARARAHLSMSEILISRKDMPAAENEFLLAQDLLRKLGNESMLAAAQKRWNEATTAPSETPAAPQAQESKPTPDADAHSRVMALLQQGFDALNKKDLPAAEAAYRKAADLAQQTGDRSNQANALNSLGFVYSRQGEDAKAREPWQQALDLSTATGDKATQALALFNLATAEFNLGNQQKADSLYEQSAALYKEIGQTPRPRPW